jgi:Flp pilus assembly pilin Flp
MTLRNQRRRKGAALVEYGLLVAGVALVATAAVAIFGSKTTDLIASIATVLPGVEQEENGPIVSGKLIETTDSTGPNARIETDIATILGNSGTERLSTNLGFTAGGGLDTLVIDPGETTGP